MSTKKRPQPKVTRTQANTSGMDTESTDDSLRNLIGFFDVLIQMDLIHQRNERSSNATTIQNTNGDNPPAD